MIGVEGSGDYGGFDAPGGEEVGDVKSWDHVGFLYEKPSQKSAISWWGFVIY